MLSTWWKPVMFVPVVLPGNAPRRARAQSIARAVVCFDAVGGERNLMLRKRTDIKIYEKNGLRRYPASGRRARSIIGLARWK